MTNFLVLRLIFTVIANRTRSVAAFAPSTVTAKTTTTTTTTTTTLVGRILRTSPHMSRVTTRIMASSNSSQDGKDDEEPRISTTNIGLVKNFRKAKGFERIYRCASTDILGDLFIDSSNNNDDDNGDQQSSNGSGSSSSSSSSSMSDLNEAQNILLNEAELILDLRSPSERNETNARKWMSYANGGRFDVQSFERNERRSKTITAGSSSSSSSSSSSFPRIVYRIDVLSPNRLFDYMSKNWVLSPTQRAQYTFNAVFDSNGLHEQRMDILNDKGLKGLYEAIIETSGPELETGLKSIVEYFESLNRTNRDGSNIRKGGVVIHCVQGKDRYVSVSLNRQFCS